MFWIALLAAQLSAPPAVKITGLFTAQDVPVGLLPDEYDGGVGVRLTVRPDGHLQSCEIEISSGIPGVDSHTCAIITRRAKFPHVLAQDGTPAYAVHRTFIRYRVTNGPLLTSKKVWTNFTLPVDGFPAGVKAPAILTLKFEADAQGHTSNCLAEDLPGSTDRHDPLLMKAACDQLLKSYTAIAPRDESGKPVPSIQDATVAVSPR